MKLYHHSLVRLHGVMLSYAQETCLCAGLQLVCGGGGVV